MAKTGHCVLLFDRSGEPADSQGGNSGWQAVLGGFVINSSAAPEGGLTWNELQSAAGSPAGSGAIGHALGTGTGNQAIDNALLAAQTRNSTYPNATPWTVKLRVFAGIYQPAWLKALANTGAWGPLLTNSSGNTMMQPWTTDYLNAWSEFMQTLAAYTPVNVGLLGNYALPLNQNPYIGEVVCGATMTTYAEPMLITSWSLAQLGFTGANAQANYDAVAQPALQTALASTVAAWTETPVSSAYNPWCNTAETFTETTMAYQISSVGSGGAGGVTPLGVLENNSVRNHSKGVKAPTSAPDPNTGLPWCQDAAYNDPLAPSVSYTAMYTAMAEYGQGAAANALGGAGYPILNPSPICIQTAGISDIGADRTDLCNTLSYCIWLGARMIELPSTYATYISPTDAASYTAGLLANDPTGNVNSAIVQRVGKGTSSDQSSVTVQNAATTVGNACILVIEARASSTPTVSVSGGGTWNNRVNETSIGNNLNLTVWDLVPSGSIPANGITISLTHAGSVAYKFYEVMGLASSPYETSAVARAASPGTGATVSVTPSHATDLVIAAIAYPSSTATVSSLPGAPWTNETLIPAAG